MRSFWVPAVLALAGCASSLTDYEARVHVVQPGETLDKIAWQHGVDYRDLARWNGLQNPNLIRVGQRIRLSAPAYAPVARAPERPVSNAPRPSAPPARRPALPPPSWQWPTQGEVVSRFGSRTGIGTGIAIAGRVGQPVRASAPGRVVYAGGGLIGYGQLVIIKHNEAYLSAYGYNSRLLVSQGQDVARGQTIAEMGLGAERQARLHFEIRRDGVPVDPLLMLPRR